MRLKILFWNIRKGQGKLLPAVLGRLAKSGVDVFAFAEPPEVFDPILNAINACPSARFEIVLSKSERVRFCVHSNGVLANASWRDRFYDSVHDRITAVELRPKHALSVLFVGAHLDSPSTGISAGGRAEEAREIARDIAALERDQGHSRTILVGDLNMNPYDSGLVEVSALHAVMSRQLVRTVAKHKARKGRDVFYNPMWSCYGDRFTPHLGSRVRPSATYYFNQTADKANAFWNMYDQVLLRPELMDNLVSLRILTNDGLESLLTKDGKPRKAACSDHLPLCFEIDLP